MSVIKIKIARQCTLRKLVSKETGFFGVDLDILADALDRSIEDLLDFSKDGWKASDVATLLHNLFPDKYL